MTCLNLYKTLNHFYSSQEQQRGSMALASDVAMLAEDIAGIRTKVDHQDSEIASLRETVGSKVENVAVNVQRAVEAERKEVQAVLAAVKTAMKKQNQQNQQVLQTLHSGQQRISAQMTDQIQVQGDKHRHIEAVVNKVRGARARVVAKYCCSNFIDTPLTPRRSLRAPSTSRPRR